MVATTVVPSVGGGAVVVVEEVAAASVVDGAAEATVVSTRPPPLHAATTRPITRAGAATLNRRHQLVPRLLSIVMPPCCEGRLRHRRIPHHLWRQSGRS